MCSLNKKLVDRLAEHGLKAGIINYEHAIQLIEEIDQTHETGGLDTAVYERYLAKYRKKHHENQTYKSIIVVAAPQESGKIEFMHEGGNFDFVIPPTYAYGDNDILVDGLVKGCLEPEGYSIERAVLPGKLAAVRSGLGSYGKNNLCYVDGMGSFHRIIAYYSDMPCEYDSWQETSIMERCSSCGKCVRSCPTGCIPKDRFLIKAERCLTHLNENNGEFPQWLNPDSHNAVVGCMNCQEVCPQNKGMLKQEAILESFNSEETSMILDGIPFEKLPAALEAKLERLCLAEYYNVLPRNLRVLIENIK